MHLIDRFKAWRERRYWERQHLDFLRMRIVESYSYLGHDPLAREITGRLYKAAGRDWYKQDIEDIVAFRQRIGLNPYQHRGEGGP